MNFGELVERCEARYHDTGNNVLSPEQWKAYINDAYAFVLTASEFWPFLEGRYTDTITTGNSLTLPEDVWRVTAVWSQTDEILLEQIDGRSEYRDTFPLEDSTGRPRNFRLMANSIEVYPVPDAPTTLVVDHFLYPDELDQDSDVPVFPRPYHRILVSGALSLAYQDDDHTDQFGIHNAALLAGIDRMKQELLGPRTPYYPGVIDLG